MDQGLSACFRGELSDMVGQHRADSDRDVGGRYQVDFLAALCQPALDIAFDTTYGSAVGVHEVHQFGIRIPLCAKQSARIPGPATVADHHIDIVGQCVHLRRDLDEHFMAQCGESGRQVVVHYQYATGCCWAAVVDE